MLGSASTFLAGLVLLITLSAHFRVASGVYRLSFCLIPSGKLLSWPLHLPVFVFLCTRRAPTDENLCVPTGSQFYSPTCDAEFLIANDTSYNGYDIQSSHDYPGTVLYSSTQDPATCCAYCFANASCTAWTVSNEAGYGYCHFCSFFYGTRASSC